MLRSFSMRQVALLLSLGMAAQVHAKSPAGLQGFYRQPALQGDALYLVAEGDLWRVAVSGGRAERLSTHPGTESSPAISPNGQWLAFVGQYDGATGNGGDIYLMPAQGGLPKRLSWEGAGLRVWGFGPQGELLYTGPSQSGQPVSQLYAVDPKTLARRALPVAQASDGALSADGKHLYFTRNGLRGDNARQYRGGAIARLWVLDLDSQAEARPLLAEGHNDSRPMPYRDAAGRSRIAFLSDRDGRVNLWSVDERGQDLRQHTRHQGWDIRHASLDGQRVAYALGADLRIIDLASEQDRPVEIRLAGDFDAQRQRWIAKPQSFLTQTRIAPDGERVLLGVRGRLATQGTGALRRAELPQPADGRCRSAEFSADSKSVFALCDFSGEVEVWRFAANGLSPAEQLTRGATALRQELSASPDGRWLAHSDKEGRLWLNDLRAKNTEPRLIDHNRVGGGHEGLAWSPDGTALVFARAYGNAGREQLVLYRLADGKTEELSSDRYESSFPAFTPDGRWLYFLSRREFAVTGNPGPWGDRNMGPYFDRGSKLYALALQPGLRFPFTVPDELAKPEAKPNINSDVKPEVKTDTKPAAKPDAKPQPKPALPAIEWSGLAARLYEVPMPAGNYSALSTDGKRLWLLDTELGTERKTSLKTLAIDDKEPKPETVSADVREYALSADGKKLMLVRGAAQATMPEILLVEAGPKLPAELARHQVRWSDWQLATDPKAEWRQMFADAWRLQRDHFYDKDMHGVDWAAMRRKYEPLVERVTERGELAELMAQMVGELGALHSQIGAGDLRSGPEEPGLAGLGARLAKVDGGLRIEQIYRSDPELPGAAGPLASAGLGIKPGDLITAVNGRPADAAPDIAELLRGQAGKQVLLALRGTDGRAYQRIVTPAPQLRERQLRYEDWRQGRAQAVQAAGQGRIGYLHLRAMGRNDIADFAREFYAHSEREGLIIDVRFNGGGNIDSWILEKLLRRAWVYWQRRSPEGSAPFANMQQAYRGHLVVLINEETYSDGETFAEGFKRLGLGVTIGKTSSGAGVWLSDRNRLLDNGIMRAAEMGQMLADGRFIIEGQGVTPDIPVDNPPRATAQGQDAQLDAAIAWLQKAMADKPMDKPRPGAYPRPASQP